MQLVNTNVLEYNYQMSGGMLAWLSLWGEMQICIWPTDATATHLLLQ